MKSHDIERLLERLGCRKISTASRGVRSTCPLASWSHSGGTDSNPSFIIFSEDKDRSSAKCKGCGFKGTITDLIWRIQKKSGQDMSALLRQTSELDIPDFKKILNRIDVVEGRKSAKEVDLGSSFVSAVTALKGKDYTDPVVFAEAIPPLPASADEHVDKMVSLLDDESVAYLTGPTRRLTAETIVKWKLGWHPVARRISVPQYDCSDRLVNLSGRYLSYMPEWLIESNAPKWMHAHGFHSELYLFGENFLDLSGSGTGMVFMCEGAFDVIYLSQCGIPNVVGVNGSHLNKIQMDKILKWFDQVVIIMDGDEPGVDAAKKIEASISPRITVSRHTISGGRDPNQLDDEEIQSIKKVFLS